MEQPGAVHDPGYGRVFPVDGHVDALGAGLGDRATQKPLQVPSRGCIDVLVEQKPHLPGRRAQANVLGAD